MLQKYLLVYRSTQNFFHVQKNPRGFGKWNLAISRRYRKNHKKIRESSNPNTEHRKTEKDQIDNERYKDNEARIDRETLYIWQNDLIIHQVRAGIYELMMSVTHEEVKSAINHLKKNTTPDAYRIMAKHIQPTQESIVPPLTKCIYGKQDYRAFVPATTSKRGSVHTGSVKGKYPRIQSDHSNNSVYTIQTKLNNLLDTTQNSLQGGFTAKTTLSNAAISNTSTS